MASIIRDKYDNAQETYRRQELTAGVVELSRGFAR
jgi:hypothetical protein